MFKVVLENLPDGEVAAIFQDGEDVLIMVSSHYDDETRCDALNRLYALIEPPAPRRCQPPRLLSVAVA